MGDEQEHEPPAGHEDQSGLRTEHPVQQDGSHDGDETEPATGPGDRCRSDTEPGPAGAQASAGSSHGHRDECQSQDLGHVGNGVPHQRQKTGPSR